MTAPLTNPSPDADLAETVKAQAARILQLVDENTALRAELTAARQAGYGAAAGDPAGDTEVPPPAGP